MVDPFQTISSAIGKVFSSYEIHFNEINFSKHMFIDKLYIMEYREMMRMKAVFIDRDGTIGGTDQVEYPGEMKLFPSTEQLIQQLKDLGYLVYSFTNQPDVSRGKVMEVDFVKELTKFGFDGVYLCPHTHEDGCHCRKPSPGMLIRAAEENDLQLQECIVIGDRWTDLLAAHEAGCKKILVKTGAGLESFHKYKNKEYYGKWAHVQPEYIAENLKDAVQWIV